jgi:toxin ParE1/3/4
LELEGLELHPDAEEELAAAVEWYEAQREGLGARLLDAVTRVLARIGKKPRQFAPWPSERSFRRAVVRRFPYVIFFVEGRPSIVFAVAHTSRLSGYWRSRASAQRQP